MKLSIVVLNYNNNKLLERCCDAVDDQEIPCEHEKIICDNGSAESPRPRHDWKIVNHEQNVGVVGGGNRAIASCGGELALFISNDVILLPGAVKELVRYIEWGYDQVQPTIYREDGSIDNCGMDLVWPGYGIGRRRWQGESTPIIPNICFVIQKRLWDSVGGLDEGFVMGYEDVDFCVRAPARRAVAKRAKAIHSGNTTLKKTLKNHRKIYAESRMRFIKKHYYGLDLWLRVTALSAIRVIRP